MDSNIGLQEGRSAAPDRRALLAELLRQKAGERVTVQPMSRGQKALWFLYQSAPDSAAYHVAFAARIRSPLNVEALRRACQHLVDRHPLLRAAFALRDGEPVQEIRGYQAVDFTVVPCPGLGQDELKGRVAAAYRRPFDLKAGTPFRAELFAGAPDDHVLLITVHHIVYDGWSLWLNLDELQQLYAAEAGGTAAALPPLAVAYSDHVEQQERLLAGPEGERLWSYWKDRLAGEIPPLNLPLDRPRPPSRRFVGASRRIALGRELSQAIKDLAQASGVTPFTLLLAAYQVLLGRYSAQDRILVGSRSMGRNDPAFADVVGYFVNPVVMAADLDGNPGFRTFLRQVHETVLGAMEHAELPFPLLVERLRQRRDPSISPVFQASFVLQKAQRPGSAIELMAASEAGSRFAWGGLELEYFNIPQQEGQFDLDLEMLDAGGSFVGWLKYDSDMFLPETIERIGDSFQILLRSIVADPDREIGRLDLLTAADRDWLAQRNRPAEPRAEPLACVHQGFERQAAATPDAVALIFEDTQLTYRELNQRANQLAHHLRGKGVGPETLVGLCAERSPEMVIGILGILKAGGAYLPLDPASPRDRLAFIIEDSKAPILVTQAAQQELVQGIGAEVVLIDQDWPAIARESTADPESGVGLENLIYVIYTSGTTGRPKGVLVTHRNVARLFSETRDWYRFGADDVWTLFHSFAFDVSVWELWGALLHGGRIVVVPYLVSRTPSEFIALVARHRVTVLNQSPSAFRLFVQEEGRRSLPGPLALRWIIFAGEALDLQSLKPWVERHGDAQPVLVNMYGITETTVHSTFRPTVRADLDRSKSTIGVPIPDLQIHLLDAHLQPVPIGVPGEIYVGGPGVTRGYLNRPELTEARFLPDPATGGALYKSGDLARYLPDGDMEYLGRIDKQVKIRGFRIELGEIETVLCLHPGITTAIVVPQDQGPAGKRLVAYLVARGGEAPSATELRGYLSERLPEYMVPSAFVPIQQIPLTGNGKLDYRALPEPSAEADASRVAVPARDDVEQRLVEIWERVLATRPVGVRDEFFEIGGHSLLAVHVTAEMESAFGREVPVSLLLRNPTIEQLAEALRAEGDDLPWSPLVPMQKAGDAVPFFCVAGGGGSVLYFQRLVQQLPRSQPFYGLQLRGTDGRAEPLQQVEAIAAECLAAIREVRPHGPYRLGGHCFGSLVAFEMAQQLRRAGEEVELLVVMDAPAPKDRTGRLNAIEPEAAGDDALWLAKVGSVLAEGAGVELPLDEEELRRCAPETRLDLVRQRMQQAGLLPAGDDAASLIRGFLQVFIANSRIRYVPADTVPLPIVLLRAQQFHPDYDYSAADDPGVPAAESSLGWNDFAEGGARVHGVPGTHVTMLVSPQVEVLAKQLSAYLS